MAPQQAFDKESWKAKVSERLTNWRERMSAIGANSVYAFLSAATLWPVVEAVQAGQAAAYMALGGVLGGIGGNLIANGIQNWKDEVDAALDIEAGLPAEPTLRDELDALLEAFDTFPSAVAELSEQDRAWFKKTLRTELERLGNLPRFEAQLDGSGAIAQGQGALAAGQRGVAVSGNMQGSTVITGDGTVINQLTGAPPHNAQEALDRYCHILVNSSRQMSLRGLDVGESDPTGEQPRLDLAQVYVDLLTTTQVPTDKNQQERRERERWREERDTEPLSALGAVAANRRVVLLGDPGSGKSTFLTHLALCLAGHTLDPQDTWTERLAGWNWEQDDNLVPMVCVLRDFARWLPADVSVAEPHHLWTFLKTRLESQTLSFVVEPLHECLDTGQAVLLLDGLDEIPTQQQRSFIRDAVTVFVERYPRCRYIVTCRTLSYQNPAWQLVNFAPFTLAPFDADQIDRFITAWYTELARLGTIKLAGIEAVSQRLQEAVRRPDLWRLASNPMLLTAMALVHTHKGRLPQARALLYEETVDILLWRWEQFKNEQIQDEPQLRALLVEAERTEVDLKRVLWRLAFEAHQTGGTSQETDGAVADIGESQLTRALAELHPDKSRAWAYQVVEVMKLRAGLLIEREPAVYTFPHRTFQEYLAGAYLSAEPEFAKSVVNLVAEGPLWREVVLLAVGRLVHYSGDTAKPLTLAAELCPAQAKDSDTGWRNAWLAGEVLCEVGRNRVEDSSLGRELAERVSQRLVDLLRKERLSPVERAAAGETLGRLGDPRFREEAWYLPNEELLGFVEIDAGPFLMGSKNSDRYAEENEKPQHTLNLPTYYIARYPVTVGQFAAFVAASGYQPQAGAYRWQGALNHPVVNVTWYDALAYCEWLTEVLREWEGTPEPLATLLRDKDWQVTLPSEAEWEKAARGTDGRIYPWGDDFDATKANVGDTGINRPSAVGSFPSGASPYGVLDMSGNVWEWTRSVYAKYPYPNDGKGRARRENLEASRDESRVLRGGGFFGNQWLARCAYRRRNHPAYAFDVRGFRVAVLPSLDSEGSEL